MFSRHVSWIYLASLRSRFTTSYEASEITRVTRVNISKIAYENAERRLSHRIWIKKRPPCLN
ncbi:AP-3 complex subunit delta [Coccidioides immitis RMSCC 3703]|uniref:AP-3 complex subunit delta n=1 Tax=Coccidioides immitis RMSCC 3703 TaxID=454286 RepID=A0A0J8RAW9_COCIT|nr:AP-3 complex subunit delta [Coccidioides immitis RMSCC 3703]